MCRQCVFVLVRQGLHIVFCLSATTKMFPHVRFVLLSLVSPMTLAPSVSKREECKGWACMGRHGNPSSHLPPLVCIAAGKKMHFWPGIPFISSHHISTDTQTHCCHSDTTKFTTPLHPNQTVVYWVVIINQQSKVSLVIYICAITLQLDSRESAACETHIVCSRRWERNVNTDSQQPKRSQTYVAGRQLKDRFFLALWELQFPSTDALHTSFCARRRVNNNVRVMKWTLS